MSLSDMFTSVDCHSVAVPYIHLPVPPLRFALSYGDVEHSEEETGPGLKGILRACCGMVLGRELKSLY